MHLNNRYTGNAFLSVGLLSTVTGPMSKGGESKSLVIRLGILQSWGDSSCCTKDGTAEEPPLWRCSCCLCCSLSRRFVALLACFDFPDGPVFGGSNIFVLEIASHFVQNIFINCFPASVGFVCFSDVFVAFFQRLDRSFENRHCLCVLFGLNESDSGINVLNDIWVQLKL